MSENKKCLCDDPQCAKCLVVNCEDDSCSVHTLQNKEKRRKLYNMTPIPQIDLDFVIARDKVCVYCKNTMKMSGDEGYDGKNRRSTEHLNHLSDVDSVGYYISKGWPVSEIIAMCCGSCNSSRLNRSLREWFKSEYCISRKINIETVAEVVQNYFKKYEEKYDSNNWK